MRKLLVVCALLVGCGSKQSVVYIDTQAERAALCVDMLELECVHDAGAPCPHKVFVEAFVNCELLADAGSK